MRVNTKYSSEADHFKANICLDIAIIKETDITNFGTDIAISNSQLVSFGEAKHMSAFVELVASFIGMVHELLPKSLDPICDFEDDILPFLYVSGRLNPTAKGLYETIISRKIKIK